MVSLALHRDVPYESLFGVASLLAILGASAQPRPQNPATLNDVWLVTRHWVNCNTGLIQRTGRIAADGQRLVGVIDSSARRPSRSLGPRLSPSEEVGEVEGIGSDSEQRHIIPARDAIPARAGQGLY